jgi:hypothetical protein
MELLGKLVSAARMLIAGFGSEIQQSWRRRGLVFDGRYYWHRDEVTPYCPPCLEGKETLRFHLSEIVECRGGEYRFCRVCKQRFWEQYPEPKERITVIRSPWIWRGIGGHQF